MRKRLVAGALGAVLVVAGSLSLAPRADASTARERIAEKRAQLGWDCSSGRCTLQGSSRSPRAPRSTAANQGRPAAESAAPASDRRAGGPKRIEISIAQQRLRAYEGQRVVLDTAVSTGRSGKATPTGNFKVQSKHQRYWSRSYSVWMPYAMRIVGGIFIHETPITTDGRRIGSSEIGSPVSAGCIRVPVGPAERLFRWAQVGTPVIIR